MKDNGKLPSRRKYSDPCEKKSNDLLLVFKIAQTQQRNLHLERKAKVWKKVHVPGKPRLTMRTEEEVKSHGPQEDILHQIYIYIITNGLKRGDSLKCIVIIHCNVITILCNEEG